MHHAAMHTTDTPNPQLHLRPAWRRPAGSQRGRSRCAPRPLPGLRLRACRPGRVARDPLRAPHRGPQGRSPRAAWPLPLRADKSSTPDALRSASWSPGPRTTTSPWWPRAGRSTTPEPASHRAPGWAAGPADLGLAGQVSPEDLARHPGRHLAAQRSRSRPAAAIGHPGGRLRPDLLGPQIRLPPLRARIPRPLGRGPGRPRPGGGRGSGLPRAPRPLRPPGHRRPAPDRNLRPGGRRLRPPHLSQRRPPAPHPRPGGQRRARRRRPLVGPRRPRALLPRPHRRLRLPGVAPGRPGRVPRRRLRSRPPRCRRD